MSSKHEKHWGESDYRHKDRWDRLIEPSQEESSNTDEDR